MQFLRRGFGFRRSPIGCLPPEKGGLAMRGHCIQVFIAASLAIATSSCGTETPNEISSLTESRNSATPEETVTVTEQNAQSKLPTTLTWNTGAKNLFAKNCGLCHSGWSFDLESFSAKRAVILNRIQSTTKPMPPTATAQWINDKEKAIEYLSNAPLK